jgi:predicted kinase
MDFKKYYFVEGTIPDFILLIGIPGSGKSFWISKFNADNKYTVVSPDQIRKQLTGNVSDQTQNVKVWTIAKERVKSYLARGKSVIFDSTMTNPQRRKEFIKDLPPSQLKAKVFYVDPEVSKSRIEKDILSGKDRADVPPDVIDRMHSELMSTVKLLDGEVLDVSKLEDEGFEIIE